MIHQFKPCLTILMGLPLTGKSTLATALASESNFVVCDLDKTRIERFGEIRELPSEQEFEILKKSYEENHNLAKDYLRENRPVIIAATYSLPFSHDLLQKLVREVDVPVKLFLLHNLKSDIAKRLKERVQKGNLSAVRSIDKFNELESHARKIQGLELIEIDTSKPLEEDVKEIFDSLKEVKLS